jgi:hypothetical protein
MIGMAVLVILRRLQLLPCHLFSSMGFGMAAVYIRLVWLFKDMGVL